MLKTFPLGKKLEMAQFEPAVEKVIANEGGDTVTDIAADRGGLTKFGISQNAFPHVQIETLTREQAKYIYKSNFWDKVRGDEIVDQSVAEAIFDTAVNMGVGAAIKLVQTTLGVKADGILGPVTIKAINQASVRDFRSSFTLTKIARYAQICNTDKSQRAFLLGWINRALRENA